MSNKHEVLFILTIIFSSTILFISEYSEVFAERPIITVRETYSETNSSYLDGVRVYGNPTICAFEIDHELNDTLISHTEKAVREWERKIGAITGDPINWAFNFRIVTEADQLTSSYMDCDMRIRFVESIPPGMDEFGDNTLGIAQPHLTYSDIWILYLEREYERKIIDEDNGYIYYENVPTGKLTNYLAKDILATIEHEIGHGLGLDHSTSRYFKIREDNAYAPSIMSHPSFGFYDQQIFQITTSDVNNVIKLYGSNGFNSYQSAEEYIMKTSEGCGGEVQIINKGFPNETSLCCQEGYELDGEFCLEINENSSDQKTRTSSTTTNSFQFSNGDEITYNLDSGEIHEMLIDPNTNSLIVNLETFTEGTLGLVFPRSLIDSKSGFEDDHFIVLINGQEADGFDSGDTSYRSLGVTVPKGNAKIEIIGTQVFDGFYNDDTSQSNPQKEKTLASFVDPNKDPIHYINRYYNEPEYKAWFDRNYPNLTIEEAVGYNPAESDFEAFADSEIKVETQSQENNIFYVIGSFIGLLIIPALIIVPIVVWKFRKKKKQTRISSNANEENQILSENLHQINDHRKSKGMKQLIIGIIAMVIPAIIFIVSSTATGGYVAFYGLFIVGFIWIVKGLINLTRYGLDKKKNTQVIEYKLD